MKILIMKTTQDLVIMNLKKIKKKPMVIRKLNRTVE